MESLSYAFEGRTLLFPDDTDFHLNGLMRNKNLLKKWDEEEEAVETTEFTDPLLPNTAKNFLLNSIDETNYHSSKPVQSCSNQFSMDNSVLSSPEPSIPSKRPRLANSQSTVPTCQVYGCNKDLSSSKDYYKRHKVCDVHSKTPVVIVNGIQQRFCQQCSRFHILAEFDEGKRSCRKRLAGHNERRRKPQLDSHFDASQTSLIFSRILPTKPVLHFHGVGKQYPSKNCLNTPSSLPECSVGLDSRCALSLLSAPAQNISGNFEGISMAHPLICKENHHVNPFTFQNSATPFGESAISSSSGVKLERQPVFSQTAFPQERNTITLFELSLHLQRVEEQRYYGEVKLENGIFGDSTIT